MLELYDYFRSSASYRVRIVLNYKSLEYKKNEVHLVNNNGEQHSQAYRNINPQELVPSLVNTDDDTVLTQSLAIIEHLEELYPEPSILPKDLNKRAEARAMAYIIACDTHPLNNLRVLQYLKKELDITDDAKIKWYHHWLKAGLSSYEHYAKKYQGQGDYSLGEELTIADVCLIPQVYNALRFELPMADYPRIMSIYNYCIEQPCFDDAKP